ncbi:MAG: LiaI-LiaF-like domain-containing protein [Suilimivivens sp.]
MGKQTIQIRRVGSVTFGTVLIVTGILFLVHIFFPAFNYFLIYRFWPVILILLGVEVLVGSRQKSYEVIDSQGRVVEQSKMVYDVPAILLMITLTGFAMCMALIDWTYEIQGWITF